MMGGKETGAWGSRVVMLCYQAFLIVFRFDPMTPLMHCYFLLPAVYRPHVDGAWPGSGLLDGKVVFDAFGDRWSRLTFLIYLNDGFEGGATTFYTPGEQEGCVEGTES